MSAALPKFSRYSAGTASARECGSLTLPEFVAQLRSGEYAERQAAIRAATGAERDALKAALPAVTLAARFAGERSHSLPKREAGRIKRVAERRGEDEYAALESARAAHLAAHNAGRTPTGYTVLDLDKVADAEAMRAAAYAVRHTLAAFVSVSGAGVKVVAQLARLPADRDDYTAGWRAAAAVYERELTVAADGSGKDEERCTFYAHDDGALLRDGAAGIEWTRPEPQASRQRPERLPEHAPRLDRATPYARAAVEGELSRIAEAPQGQRHGVAGAAAMRLYGLVLVGELAEAEVRRAWQAEFERVKPEAAGGEADDYWAYAQANAAPADIPQSAQRRPSLAERRERAQRRGAGTRTAISSAPQRAPAEPEPEARPRRDERAVAVAARARGDAARQRRAAAQERRQAAPVGQERDFGAGAATDTPKAAEAARAPQERRPAPLPQDGERVWSGPPAGRVEFVLRDGKRWAVPPVYFTFGECGACGADTAVDSVHGQCWSCRNAEGSG